MIKDKERTIVNLPIPRYEEGFWIIFRGLLHTELHRSLWHDLDHLQDDLYHWDREKTGCIPRESLYAILRGCRIPIDVELLNAMLDQ